MIRRNVSLPEIGLIAGTRAALGAGIGLLLADRLNNDQRRAVGWTLLAVGVISSVPLAAELLLRDGRTSGLGGPSEFPPVSQGEREPSLAGA